jgi:exosome complex RNA-binding protein Rrp42 (RNase PH superfamily)
MKLAASLRLHTPCVMTVSALERESVLKALSSGIRLDGRGFKEHREIKISFSHQKRGQISVELGKTR